MTRKRKPQNPWKDTAGHIAGHRWTVAPLAAAAAAAATTALALEAAPWTLTLTGVAASVAAANACRLIGRTKDYTNGRTRRPPYVAPTPAQAKREADHAARMAAPDGFYTAPAGAAATSTWRCGDCNSQTDRLYERKVPTRRHTDIMTFAMCDACLGRAQIGQGRGAIGTP